jgi:hypothetical protein
MAIHTTYSIFYSSKNIKFNKVKNFKIYSSSGKNSNHESLDPIRTYPVLQRFSLRLNLPNKISLDFWGMTYYKCYSNKNIKSGNNFIFCWNNEFLSLDEKNRLDFIEKFNNLEFIKSLLNFLKIERYAFQKESIFDSNSLIYTSIDFI